MHGNQAYSSLVLVVIGLAQLALPAAAGAECPGNLFECVVEPSADWLALGSLSLFLSSATGGLLAVAWHLIMRGVAGAGHRGNRSGARAPRVQGGAPAGRLQPRRAVPARRVERPAPTRVIVGPVWSDGHWLRMVTSQHGGQRIEILRSEGWEASDRDLGSLATEGFSCTTRQRTGPPQPPR